MVINYCDYSNYQRLGIQNTNNIGNISQRTENNTTNIFGIDSKSVNTGTNKKQVNSAGTCVKNGLDFTNIINNPARTAMLKNYYNINPFAKLPPHINSAQNNQYVKTVVQESKAYYKEIVSALNSASSDDEAEKAAELIVSKYSQIAAQIEAAVTGQPENKQNEANQAYGNINTEPNTQNNRLMLMS